MPKASIATLDASSDKGQSHASSDSRLRAATTDAAPSVAEDTAPPPVAKDAAVPPVADLSPAAEHTAGEDDKSSYARWIEQGLVDLIAKIGNCSFPCDPDLLSKLHLCLGVASKLNDNRLDCLVREARVVAQPDRMRRTF